MVRFRYIIVVTLHNVEKKDDDDDDNNNNNNNGNNIFTHQSALKLLCSVHHCRISYPLNIHSD